VRDRNDRTLEDVIRTFQNRILELYGGKDENDKLTTTIRTFDQLLDIDARTKRLNDLRDALKKKDYRFTDVIDGLYTELNEYDRQADRVTLTDAYFYNRYRSPNSPLTSGNSPNTSASLDDVKNAVQTNKRSVNETQKRDRLRSKVPEYAQAIARAYVEGHYHHDMKNGASLYPNSIAPMDYSDLDQMLGVGGIGAFDTLVQKVAPQKKARIADTNERALEAAKQQRLQTRIANANARALEDPEQKKLRLAAFNERVREVSGEKPIQAADAEFDFLDEPQIAALISEFMDGLKNVEESGDPDRYIRNLTTVLDNSIRVLDGIIDRLHNRRLQNRTFSAFIDELLGIAASVMAIRLTKDIMTSLYKNITPEEEEGGEEEGAEDEDEESDNEEDQ